MKHTPEEAKNIVLDLLTDGNQTAVYDGVLEHLYLQQEIEMQKNFDLRTEANSAPNKDTWDEMRAEADQHWEKAGLYSQLRLKLLPILKPRVDPEM